ncbi:unnamed protein product, partial [marine sediment metagenome]
MVLFKSDNKDSYLCLEVCVNSIILDDDMKKRFHIWNAKGNQYCTPLDD